MSSVKKSRSKTYSLSTFLVMIVLFAVVPFMLFSIFVVNHFVNIKQEASERFLMKTSEELSVHLDNVRHLYSKGGVPKMHKIAYHVYNKKYQKPSKREGFDRIETAQFCLTDALRRDKLWMRYFRRWSSA